MYPASRSSCRRRPCSAPQQHPRPRPGPLFEHKKLYRSVRGEVPDPTTWSCSGGAGDRAGHHVTVIVWPDGPLQPEAAELVGSEGISAEATDLRTLRRSIGRPSCRHQEDRQGGHRLRGQPLRWLRAEVAAIIAEEAFDYPMARSSASPPRRPRCPVQPPPRGLVHGQPRQDRGRHPETRGVLTRTGSGLKRGSAAGKTA